LKTYLREYHEGNQTTTMMRKDASLSGEPNKKKCPGITNPAVLLDKAAALKPVKLSGSLAKTSVGLNPSCKLHTTYQKGSPPPNGTKSSEENPLTSTNSFHQCTVMTSKDSGYLQL